MTTYCDASLIVSALAAEDLSPLARSFLDRLGTRDAVVSGWVGSEVASALALKRRRGDIDDDQRSALLARWRQFRDLVSTVQVEARDFERAADLVDAGARGLRAGDALHLAITMRTGLALATLDRDLADAAAASEVVVALRPPA